MSTSLRNHGFVANIILSSLCTNDHVNLRAYFARYANSRPAQLAWPRVLRDFRHLESSRVWFRI